MNQYDLKWLDKPEIFRVNKVEAHSDHKYYESKEAYESGNNLLTESLNGMWKFHYSKNSKERPTDFYHADFDASNWDEIRVPSHIEMSDYDKIHYINTMYPWEGHIYRRPSYSLGNSEFIGQFSEAEYNPVGSYLLKFDLTNTFKGKNVSVVFAGVEQAMYVWLNGEFVGYSEDSFTPAEFDLTPFIKEKDNVLAVEVHKRSTAAFLEDQDFFRFFGIFRPVFLHAKPKIHVEDLTIKSQLKKDNTSGEISFDFKITGDINSEKYKLKIQLIGSTIDKEEKQLLYSDLINIDAKLKMDTVTISDILLWDNENPNLYLCTFEVVDEQDNTIEFIPQEIGFRRVELEDGIIKLNGKRLIINGVNRHEWNALSGRVITQEDMEQDITIMQKNNINSVRTSHYPSQVPWYLLCDKNGLYVMAECNLETHGSWQKMGAVEPSWNVPGSIPMWKEAVLDRAANNYHLLKNHVSILFWSLGNESYSGDNIAYMNEFFKQIDDTRLVHYEGVFHNEPDKKRISDMESHMYSKPEVIEEYLKNNPTKPFILCEYMHNMGNSLGGMKSYMDLLDKYPMYQGGFIWDYIDQALLVKDTVTGQMVMRYGGDFDDRPSDYEFSGNGILFADRSEKPAMQEVKYYYGLYK